MRTLSSRLALTLFGKTRRAVMGLLYMHDTERYYLRQIAALTGQSTGALQREMSLLEEAGIIARNKQGHQVFYQANPNCPIFPELKSIFTKTSGVADLLRNALEPISDRCRVAMIYGSVAAGTDDADSDVDVMVIGDVTFAEVSECLGDIQDQIHREVNPSVYPPEEFASKTASPYLQSVLRNEKIFLIGDEDELGRLAAEQLAH